MPPLKGRALVDELCFKLPTYLQEQLGVTQIQVDARAGCTARMEIKLFPEEYSKQNWVLCAAVDPRRAECEPCESG